MLKLDKLLLEWKSLDNELNIKNYDINKIRYFIIENLFFWWNNNFNKIFDS